MAVTLTLSPLAGGEGTERLQSDQMTNFLWILAIISAVVGGLTTLAEVSSASSRNNQGLWFFATNLKIHTRSIAGKGNL